MQPQAAASVNSSLARRLTRLTGWLALQTLAVALVYPALPKDPDGGVLWGYSASVLALSGLCLLTAAFLAFAFFRFRRNPPLRLAAFLHRHTLAIFLIGLALTLLVGWFWLIGLPANPDHALNRYTARLLPALIGALLAALEIALFVWLAGDAQYRTRLAHWLRPLSLAPQADSRPRAWFTALLLLAFAALQALRAAHTSAANIIGDSGDYLYLAGLPLHSPDFYAAFRPWGAALLYKLTGPSPQTILWAQTALHALCWSALAVWTARSLRNRRVSGAALAILLLFALSPTLDSWNAVILSESLSLSVLALLTGLWIDAVSRWSWWKTLPLLLVSFLWMNVRETNAYLALALAAMLIGLAVLLRRQKMYAVLGAALIGLYFLTSTALCIYPRWSFPLLNVLGKRILPVEENVQYFRRQGMPLSPALMSLSGQWANGKDFAFLNSEELRPFQKWLFEDGRNAYLRYMLDHWPQTFFRGPFDERRTLLAPDVRAYPPASYAPALPAWLSAVVFPDVWPAAQIGLAAALLAAALISGAWKQRAAVAVGAVLLLLDYPHLLVVWNGDAMEMARHAVVAAVQFHLAVWLLIFGLADVLLDSRSRRPGWIPFRKTKVNSHEP